MFLGDHSDKTISRAMVDSIGHETLRLHNKTGDVSTSLEEHGPRIQYHVFLCDYLASNDICVKAMLSLTCRILLNSANSQST